MKAAADARCEPTSNRRAPCGVADPRAVVTEAAVKERRMAGDDGAATSGGASAAPIGERRPRLQGSRRHGAARGRVTVPGRCGLLR